MYRDRRDGCIHAALAIGDGLDDIAAMAGWWLKTFGGGRPINSAAEVEAAMKRDGWAADLTRLA